MVHFDAFLHFITPVMAESRGVTVNVHHTGVVPDQPKSSVSALSSTAKLHATCSHTEPDGRQDLFNLTQNTQNGSTQFDSCKPPSRSAKNSVL